MIAVRPILGSEIYRVRSAVMKGAEPSYAEDERGLHLAGYREGRLSGVCSFVYDPLPDGGGRPRPAFRLYGLAVLPEDRGEGVAGLMLLTAGDKLLSAGTPVLWTAAREEDRGFFERQGFTVTGPAGEDGFLMEKLLKAHTCG